MEDRQQKKQVDPEREALIAEMLRDAEGRKVELPSELTKNPVLNPEDKTAPPTVVTGITSAGYVYVWDTRTYVKAPVLYYILAQVLRQRREDGSYRWTTNDPGKLPKRGTYVCMLHKDHPNRKHYDELGFRVCPRDGIINAYQVTQHMKSKHRAEWATIEQERVERERQEDRRLQQLMVEAVAGKTIEAAGEAKKSVFVCDVCGADFGAQITLEKHKKEQHK